MRGPPDRRLIARAHLAPAVSAAVDDLLRQNPIDSALNRFCKDRPNDPMADAATWADDVKYKDKTAVWHYVDIPRAVRTVTSLDPWCPPADRSSALRYVIHLVGDIHQPLHDTNNNDEGGNCTAMRFFAKTNRPASMPSGITS